MTRCELAPAAVTRPSQSPSRARDEGRLVQRQRQGYYYDVIVPDDQRANRLLHPAPVRRDFVMDQSRMDLPNRVDMYERHWAQPPESQGKAGTCWAFGSTSFFESEVYRLTGVKTEISELHTVYWEYVERARRFVRERGNSAFGQGSQLQAVQRMMRLHGAVPKSAYNHIGEHRKFHSHAAMFEEMRTYLQAIKRDNAWNEEQVVATIRRILDHYLGAPPSEFEVDGKTYTPQTYLRDCLKIEPDDYVEVLSIHSAPFWTRVENPVPDNWWHSKDFYNVPIEEFMAALERANKEGFSMAIAGDISEAGWNRATQCAVVPDFDIPYELITDDARQFRICNGTTTDDHAMHLVGMLENYKGDGFNWYLFKDSGSGSRNGDPRAPEFGHYFVREDYIKLKMTSFLVHKDAVPQLLARAGETTHASCSGAPNGTSKAGNDSHRQQSLFM